MTVSRLDRLGRGLFLVTFAGYLLLSAGFFIAGGEPDREGLLRAGRLILLVERPENGLALGFDRAPLLSLAMALWLPVPGIRFGEFAGPFTASLATALTTVLLSKVLEIAGIAGRWRALVVAASVENPLVVVATASGSPNAASLCAQLGFLLAIAVWLRRGATTWLMIVGFAAGLAVLTEFRFIGLLLAVIIVVVVRSTRAGQLRRPDAELIALLLPVLFLLGLWSIVSWIATGSALSWVDQLAGRFSVADRLAVGLDCAAIAALLLGLGAATWRQGATAAVVVLLVLLVIVAAGPLAPSIQLASLPALTLAGACLARTLTGTVRSTFYAALSIVIFVGVPITVEQSVSRMPFPDRPVGEMTSIADIRAAARLLDTATAPRLSLVDGDLGDIVIAFADRPDRYLTPRDPEFSTALAAISGSVELLLVGGDVGPIGQRHPEVRRRSVDWARIELDRPGLRVLRLNEPVRSIR